MFLTVVTPGFEILTPTDGILEHLELCGRTCYKSEDRITDDSAAKFVRMVCKRNHESVLEHCVIGVRIIGSRAMSHQLVRHRIAAYSQESQRFCNYGKKGLAVICPPSIGLAPGDYFNDPSKPDEWMLSVSRRFDCCEAVVSPLKNTWLKTVGACYQEYLNELEAGLNPEDARYILPNATKTEIATTYNLRVWRHIFKERALNLGAQWEIRQIMLGLLVEFGNRLPEVFGDLLTQVMQGTVQQLPAKETV